uniref:Uncharacterized protein n=1 Tax=Oryza barthii TaxID=65489 RepID=A0A0D3HRX7_9ORYZ
MVGGSRLLPVTMRIPNSAPLRTDHRSSYWLFVCLLNLGFAVLRLWWQEGKHLPDSYGFFILSYGMCAGYKLMSVMMSLQEI